jgi:hypothetical protein
MVEMFFLALRLFLVKTISYFQIAKIENFLLSANLKLNFLSQSAAAYFTVQK